MAIAEAIGDDDAAVVSVAQALQPAGGEEFHALGRIGRVGENQVRAAEGSLRKAEAQVAGQAPHADSQACRLSVDELQGCLVDVHDDQFGARADLGHGQ